MNHFRQMAALGLRARNPSTRTFSTVKDVPITTRSMPCKVSQSANLLQSTIKAEGPRVNWTKEEISTLYNTPLFELQYAAASFFSPLLFHGTIY